MSDGLNTDLNEAIDNTPYLVKLPEKGWGTEKILEEAVRYTKFGEYFFLISIMTSSNEWVRKYGCHTYYYNISIDIF